MLTDHVPGRSTRPAYAPRADACLSRSMRSCFRHRPQCSSRTGHHLCRCGSASDDCCLCHLQGRL